MSRKAQILEFLKSNPDDEFLNYALAIEHIAESQDELAKSVFEKLMEKSPDYVATYYHMGKLLEREADTETAKKVYQIGIEVAKKVNDRHALSELQSAFLELEYGD